MSMKKKLLLPDGYSSWLEYAIDNINIRLVLDIDQCQKQARLELKELRAKAENNIRKERLTEQEKIKQLISICGGCGRIL